MWTHLKRETTASTLGLPDATHALHHRYRGRTLCGIAGIVATEGPVDPGLVERMCQTMDHRGPDSRGVFADDGIALGVARLAVIDVDGGDQPLANEDGSVVVVCNGEIY